MDVVARIKKDEGFSQFAYRCTGGKWTVGYGRNIDQEGGKGVSKNEAHMLLLFDIRECEDDLVKIFGALRWSAILGVRQNALTNMRFQLGGSGFRTFVRMIAAIRNKDWDMVAREAEDSDWFREAHRLGYIRRALRVIEELRSGIDLE